MWLPLVLLLLRPLATAETLAITEQFLVEVEQRTQRIRFQALRDQLSLIDLSVQLEAWPVLGYQLATLEQMMAQEPEAEVRLALRARVLQVLEQADYVTNGRVAVKLARQGLRGVWHDVRTARRLHAPPR